MSWIKNTLVLIISLILSLFLLEFAVRFIFPNQNLDLGYKTEHTYGRSNDNVGYSNNCDHGWCANPGIYSNNVKKMVNQNGETELIYAVEYSIGADGFRVTKNSTEIADVVVNFFGGSFVFGEGLNDNQTLPYFVASSASNIDVNNYGFHGHGVHNAVRIIETKKSKKSTYNVLLTGSYHASRSDCVQRYSAIHPSYELDKSTEGAYVSYRGRCSSYPTTSWLLNLSSKLKAYGLVERSRTIQILHDYLNSSFSSHQLELYQALISEFVRLSKERGEIPIVMYMKQKSNSSYLTAGFAGDPVWSYLEQSEGRVIDATLPDEREFFIHDMDKHPSALANCIRAAALLTALNLGESNSCDEVYE